MEQATILALTRAGTEADLQRAVEDAARWNNAAHPRVQEQVRHAQIRLTRQVRLRKLLSDMTDPVPLSRQDSHLERLGLLAEANTRRSVGLDMALLDDTMRQICKDYRCADCSEGSAYRSTCLQFMLSCLSIRVSTRLHYDRANSYNIDPQITALMTRLVQNPMLVWLDQNDQFMALPDELERMYNVVVKPTVVNRKTAKEAREYDLHANSIRKIVESIARCEAADITSSTA